MKNTRIRLILAMFFCASAIGANDCEFLRGEVAPPPSTNPPPDKPFCMTDPPYGCVAYCLSLDEVAFTVQCSNPGSGPRTSSFEAYVNISVQMILDDGGHFCTDPGTQYGQDGVDNSDYTTPCSAGYPPQVLKSESLDACTPPPPWC